MYLWSKPKLARRNSNYDFANRFLHSVLGSPHFETVTESKVGKRKRSRITKNPNKDGSRSTTRLTSLDIIQKFKVIRWRFQLFSTKAIQKINLCFWFYPSLKNPVKLYSTWVYNIFVPKDLSYVRQPLAKEKQKYYLPVGLTNRCFTYMYYM